MLLVVVYSRGARESLRNVCRSHEEVVVRRFGRVALFEETEFAAFQALRLREKHGRDVQIERTEPFNEFEALDESVREAARAYETRDTSALPYRAFAAGTGHPDPGDLRNSEL